MSNIVSVNPSLPANFTPEQMQLITSTIAKGATPDELKLFLYRCKNMGLDPLKPGQIHFVKYGAGPGTIVVGIEGFRSLAGRTGMLSGVSRGVLRDGEGNVTHGWAEVHRSDWKHPAREEVPMAEYNTGKGPWAKMPETMIKKVAEAAALRMAFPDVLGGVYTKEEMDQAEKDHNPMAAKNFQPEPGDGEQRTGTGLFIKYGKFANRWLNQVEPPLLRDWILEEEAKSAKAGKSLSPWMQKVIAEAEPLIAAYENEHGA